MIQRREPLKYVCPECGGRSELTYSSGVYRPPDIVVYHLAGCRFEGSR